MPRTGCLSSSFFALSSFFKLMSFPSVLYIFILPSSSRAIPDESYPLYSRFSRPLSIVSDTYDYWNVITNYLPRLKNSIMNREGKIIIRGDSGNPIDIICGELRGSDYKVYPELTGDKMQMQKFFAKMAMDEGKLEKDDKVLIIGFGVGYSWGAVIITI